MFKTYSVKLDNTLANALHTFAVENDLKVSQVIRHAIRAHIDYKAPKVDVADKPTTPTKQGLTEADKAAVIAAWED
jgi:predicted transcriptional regulator